MRSDAYTITFTMIVAIILGLGLSTTADNLRERQNLNVELDIKKNILSVLGFEQNTNSTNEDIQNMYDKNISEIIINSTGEIIEDNNVSSEDTYKIYQSRDGSKVTGYAIPIAGKGLWGTMYGYFAIEPDVATAKGITFYKHKETPGLGAEVIRLVQNNFIGKNLLMIVANLSVFRSSRVLSLTKIQIPNIK